MPETSHDRRIASSFLCEHTPSKSRIYAIMRKAGSESALSAVMTCADRAVAAHAAQVLNAAVADGDTDAVRAAADEVANALPTAPASSFRKALENVCKNTWPAPQTDAAEAVFELATSPWTGPASRTPDAARLTDLSGKVVRIISLREYHVYDEQRLSASAQARGFVPLPAEDLDPDDPLDLVGAVSYLADSQEPMPGVDVLTESDILELLQAPMGEVADWSSNPVTADFGKGWRLRTVVPKGPHKETAWGLVPDFAISFAVGCTECEADPDQCEDWHLTPRTADILHGALEILSDEAYDDVENHGGAPMTKAGREDWTVFDRLPELTWNQPVSWRREFARAAGDLADDLAEGNWPIPSTTMEEMALHLAIEDAPGHLEVTMDGDAPDHRVLPEHPHDYDWDYCSEAFFQDADVLMLFNENLNGIEDPRHVANEMGGVGDLRANAWSEPFNNVKPRDPDRGFRR